MTIIRLKISFTKLRFTSYRVHTVKKFDNIGEDMEDLISIETIELIKVFNNEKRKLYRNLDFWITGRRKL